MGTPRLRFGELPGENLEAPALTDVASWISIYEELASVLRAILSRANGQALDGELQKTLALVEDRLESWRDRHAALFGARPHARRGEKPGIWSELDRRALS